MVYVIKHKTKVNNICAYKIVNKSFSCLPSELIQELVTYCRIDLLDFIEYKSYNSLETAKLIVRHKCF